MSAEVPTEDADTVQPSTTEPVFAEGNTSPRKLSIHGLDGSMFHIAVEDATTVTRFCEMMNFLICFGRSHRLDTNFSTY